MSESIFDAPKGVTTVSFERFKEVTQALKSRIAHLELQLERTRAKSSRRKKAIKGMNHAIIDAQYMATLRESELYELRSLVEMQAETIDDLWAQIHSEEVA